MTGIIILNWNGDKDTIECLRSLYRINDSKYFIVLVDNGSEIESIERIQQYLKSNKEIVSTTVDENQVNNNDFKAWLIENKTTIIYKLNENYGFAKGNNVGIELAKKFNPDYLLMLNNDTEVEPDFLSKLVQFHKEHPNYVALCPKISLYYKKGYIWNCGGALFWGFRKYYYNGKHESKIRENEYIEAEYVTGCAFFFPSSLVKDKKLLTEKFFHGEEDFELGYRFKKLKYKMACVLSSHIYHKVGLATKSLDNIGKKYCYYLLRFIDMRQQMPYLSYITWRIVYSFYIIRILRRNNLDYKRMYNFLKKLYKESSRLEGVD